jgi:hypothetical protein
MVWTKPWDGLLLTEPNSGIGALGFLRRCRKTREPTSGLEPLPCSLRVSSPIVERWIRSFS